MTGKAAGKTGGQAAGKRWVKSHLLTHLSAAPLSGRNENHMKSKESLDVLNADEFVYVYNTSVYLCVCISEYLCVYKCVCISVYLCVYLCVCA